MQGKVPEISALILLTVCAVGLTILRGGNLELATEVATEDGSVGETGLRRDLVDGQVCRNEQLAGIFQSQVADELRQRVVLAALRISGLGTVIEQFSKEGLSVSLIKAGS